MNTYENEIKEAQEKIAGLKKLNKGYTGSLVQSDLNQLQKAIKSGDEEAAEKWAKLLSDHPKIVVDDSNDPEKKKSYG